MLLQVKRYVCGLFEYLLWGRKIMGGGERLWGEQQKGSEVHLANLPDSTD